MVDFLSNLVSYGGTGLMVVLVYLLIRGPLNRYFPLFLYIATYLMSSLAEGYVVRTHGTASHAYFDVYWGGELLLDLLLFFLVTSLTWQALEGTPMRRPALHFLVIVMLVVLTIPLVAFNSPIFRTKWNNLVSELFNFGAAVMSLGLWSALLVTKRRDRQLLVVTAGLGVALASAAMTMAMRHYTEDGTIWRDIIDWMHRLFNIGSVLIWCWAFWPARKPAPAASSSPASRAS